MGSSRITAALLAGAGALVAQEARASNGLDSAPDIGAEQLGRGGAWVARASDPFAAYMNPAAMSFQSHGVAVGAHLIISNVCFTRLGPDGQPVSPGNGLPGPGAPGGPEAEQCASSVFPNPQIAAVIKPTDRFAIGLAVVAPHSVGSTEFGESVAYGNAGLTQPAPGRYLSTNKEAIALFPTISLSYAITDEFSIGAGFTWGIASVNFSNFTESISTNLTDSYLQDVKATFSSKDLFIPGFVVGVDWKVVKMFELGAWYRLSDGYDGSADLDLESIYWSQAGMKRTDACTDPRGCRTQVEDAGFLRFAVPMEAKIGARFHYPLPGAIRETPDFAKGNKLIKDPLSQDLFDVEIDLTWAHNSQMDDIEVRFCKEKNADGDCTGTGSSGIPVNGTPGETPANADIPHEWRDVLGVRLGADVNVLPGRLALRAGGYFESQGQDPAYLNLDFLTGFKVGVTGGATVRVGPVDITAAYAHTFYGTLDNGGKGKVKAISGDASTNFRSQTAVNGGRLGASLNVVALNGTLRF